MIVDAPGAVLRSSVQCNRQRMTNETDSVLPADRIRSGRSKRVQHDDLVATPLSDSRHLPMFFLVEGDDDGGKVGSLTMNPGKLGINTEGITGKRSEPLLCRCKNPDTMPLPTCPPFRGGDRKALARAITRWKMNLPDTRELLHLLTRKQVCRSQDFTGPPGAGKSTLINALGTPFT